MERRKKVIVAIVTGAALAAIGGGVVLASAGTGDERLRGSVYERATATALEFTSGGTVLEAEVGDDRAAYEVEIRMDDGSITEIELDEDFDVIGAQSEGYEGDAEDGEGGR